MGFKGVTDDYGDVAISAAELEFLADVDISSGAHTLHRLELIAATSGRDTRRTLNVYFDQFLVHELLGREGVVGHTKFGEVITFVFTEVGDSVPFIVDCPELTQSERSEHGFDFLT